METKIQTQSDIERGLVNKTSARVLLGELSEMATKVRSMDQVKPGVVEDQLRNLAKKVAQRDKGKK